MANYDIVAIGTSAGGLRALTELLVSFPRNFPATILIVQHLEPDHKSLLSEILQRNCNLKVKEAQDGEPIDRSVVYTAPPNKHMLVADNKISLTETSLVHFTRPSIDLLFGSVAAEYDSRVVGVILTGTGVDGAIGIKAIKEKGGVTIAQDNETSEYFGMPYAAIKIGAVDYVLPLHEIGPAIVRLVMPDRVIAYD